MKQTFKSLVRQEIDEFRKKLAELEERSREEKNKWLAGFKVDGWKYFQFVSDFDGSVRRDDYVVRREFLFHSSLDISQWHDVRFFHTRYGGQCEQERAFNKWLKTLADEHYIEIF